MISKINYQIEHQDLSQKAYHKLKEMILQEHFKAGEKITQEQIARELGISRMPLHKAFQMLESELLVELRPRRGYYIKEIDLEEIADAFECREAIEGIAARRAAELVTLKDIREMSDLFEPFSNNPSDADLIKYQEADHIFHNMIIKLSQNRILLHMEMLGNVLIHTYRRGLIRPPSETLHEHFAIIEALRRGDGKLSEALIRNHFIKSRKVVLQRIKNINRKKLHVTL
ncbi:MAG: GntR family transcriptional regulator [Bacteroidales bacterium]|nr:GntR family transcriptional regulator [Bacteroidales bacterium]